MATAMPPLAVPSSLVRTMPVTPADWVKRRACWRPFWPVVASMTRRDFVGRAGETTGGGAAHLVELVHEAGFGVEAAGGVDVEVVYAAGFGCRDGSCRGTAAGSPPCLVLIISTPERVPDF